LIGEYLWRWSLRSAALALGLAIIGVVLISQWRGAHGA
jgi:hypothetical protein